MAQKPGPEPPGGMAFLIAAILIAVFFIARLYRTKPPPVEDNISGSETTSLPSSERPPGNKFFQGSTPDYHNDSTPIPPLRDLILAQTHAPGKAPKYQAQKSPALPENRTSQPISLPPNNPPRYDDGSSPTLH